MTISLDLIQILDAIDRHGSFEAAAQELHKVRSALTYNIRAYETYSGIKLFDRSKHRAEFTPAGRILLDQGRHLLMLSNQVEENVKFAAKGWETVLRIAYDEALNTAPIIDLIKHFQTQCPHVNLEMFSEILGGCTEALINNHVDIVIGASGRLPQRPEFSFEPIGKIKFAFAISPDHPLAKTPDPIDTKLIQQFYVIYTRDSSQRFSRQSASVFEHRSITFSSLEMKKQAQIAKLGVGFLPYNLIKDEVKSGELVIKKVKKTKPESMFYIGWNNEKNTKAQRWVIQQILDKKFKSKLIKA